MNNSTYNYYGSTDLLQLLFTQSFQVSKNGFNEIYCITHLQRITLPERQMHDISPSEPVFHDAHTI